MAKLAFTITFLYAAVSLVGGILGSLKDSPISLVAGGIAAILLAAGAWFGMAGKLWGPILALVVCVALIGRFLPKFLGNMSGMVWPHGVMAILGIVTAAVLVPAILAMRR